MATLIKNGKIYVEKGTYEQAMVVENGYIRAVGANEAMEDLAGAGAEVIDCGGRTVIPGFNDSHIHLMLYGTKRKQVRIGQAKSIEEIIEICRAFMRQYPQRTSRGILAIGWNQDTLAEKRMPNRNDLDRISTDIPIVLRRVCGHVLAANTMALEQIIDRGDMKKVPDELYEKDSSGKLNGVLYEAAAMEGMTIIPDPSDEERDAALVDVMHEAVSYGITSVQANDISPNTGDEDQVERVTKKIFDEGRSPLRLRWQCFYRELDKFKASLDHGVFSRREEYNRGRMLTVGPLKLFKDGSLGGRSALLRGEYADAPGVSGVATISEETAKEFCRIAADNGLQVITHSIGDGAIDSMMNAYESVSEAGNPLRHCILHCQITDRQMLERIRDNGFLVSYQPCYLNSDLYVVDNRVGGELASTSNAFGTLYQMIGRRMSLGTDCPIENMNPFENVYCAVTRKDQGGYPPAGYYPQECMDVSDAIDAYTAGSAYCEFAEDWKGRLKPGYCADLVVLDGDIFTVPAEKIREIRPVMTMVDGKVVYQK